MRKIPLALLLAMLCPAGLAGASEAPPALNDLMVSEKTLPSGGGGVVSGTGVGRGVQVMRIGAGASSTTGVAAT